MEDGNIFLFGMIQPMNWLATIIMCLTAQFNAVGIRYKKDVQRDVFFVATGWKPF